MKTFKLHRSRIVHEPVSVGCTIRSGSDSGLFLKVVDIIPNDYPITRELTKWNKDTKLYETTGKETNFYDRVIVETYAHVKCGICKFSKKPLTREGYISSYSNEVVQVETLPAATHPHWHYDRADMVVIKVTTDQAYEQGKRKRIRNEAYFKNRVKQWHRHIAWCEKEGRKVGLGEPNYQVDMADRVKWDNPYKFEGYDNALSDAWVAGHIGQARIKK